MRVSCNPDDPGYVASPWGVKVFLDGVEQRKVITADEEEGTVLRYVLDAQGGAQLDPKNPEEAWRETVRGSVRIEFPS
jgi:hypothetical protein